MSTEYEIDVNGMSCGGCEKSIETVVKKIDGVADVRASHTARKVLVSGTGFDEGAVRQAIRTAGFEVKE